MTYSLEQLKNITSAIKDSQRVTSWIVLTNQDGTTIHEGPVIDIFFEVAKIALPELVEYVEMLGRELADAANEINCAGPIVHRIRILRKEHDERCEELKAEIARLTDLLEAIRISYL